MLWILLVFSVKLDPITAQSILYKYEAISLNLILRTVVTKSASRIYTPTLMQKYAKMYI